MKIGWGNVGKCADAALYQMVDLLIVAFLAPFVVHCDGADAKPTSSSHLHIAGSVK